MNKIHAGRGPHVPGRWCLLVAPVCMGGLVFVSAQETKPSFPRDIAPVLGRSCLSCHGPTQQMFLLDLSTRAAALKGGQKSGPSIVPGDSSRSPFYRRLTGQDQPAMPLGGKLSDAEIRTIKDWIDAGAIWDSAAPVAPPAPPTASSGEKKFTDQDRAWWAFRPPVRHPLPAVADARWRMNPIDSFLKKALDEHGLEPAPAADRRTLIRRVYLDMIG